MSEPADLDRVFRQEWPRILAAVIRYTASVERAEDAVQEAFARATASRDRDVLLNPAAWITTVAKRIAVDMARRERSLDTKLALLPVATELSSDRFEAPGGDDRLGLLFVACAPQLSADARLAVALRFVCGIPTPALADALLVSHATMSARLTRAKRAIDSASGPLAPRTAADLADRLDDVLATVHVLYTVGHSAFDGDTATQYEVTAAAIELARALDRIAPDDLEVTGLLALLLLTEARAPTRLGHDGRAVTLERADRSRWDSRMIGEGLDRAATALPGMGRFALEAGISGLHSSAASWEATDWPAICLLYDRLVERWPSPAAQVARVVARSYLDNGLEPALAELEAIDGAPQRHLTATRADILRRSGRGLEARAEYLRAAALEHNGTVRAFYESRASGS